MSVWRILNANMNNLFKFRSKLLNDGYQVAINSKGQKVNNQFTSNGVIPYKKSFFFQFLWAIIKTSSV